MYCLSILKMDGRPRPITRTCSSKEILELHNEIHICMFKFFVCLNYCIWFLPAIHQRLETIVYTCLYIYIYIYIYHGNMSYHNISAACCMFLSCMTSYHTGTCETNNPFTRALAMQPSGRNLVYTCLYTKYSRIHANIYGKDANIHGKDSVAVITELRSPVSLLRSTYTHMYIYIYIHVYTHMCVIIVVYLFMYQCVSVSMQSRSLDHPGAADFFCRLLRRNLRDRNIIIMIEFYHREISI